MSARPHIALDAFIVSFQEDGRPVWRPRIIERWDDATVAVTYPDISSPTWRGAISQAHAWLAQTGRLF